MRVDISGTEEMEVSCQRLWDGLNDPAVLIKSIPGCKSMMEIEPDRYTVEMHLKVAAVGGSFEGEVALSDKTPPQSCCLTVSGAGTLGNGTGTAEFTITEIDQGKSLLSYEGTGEIGGLVAGVGQRILGSVSKHLIKQFFTALRKQFAEEEQTMDAS